jgi:hypothetical protein
VNRPSRKVDLEPLGLWEYAAIHPHLAGYYQLISGSCGRQAYGSSSA